MSETKNLRKSLFFRKIISAIFSYLSTVELNRHLNDINTKRPVIVLADGHGSRFDEKVLS